ncbi:MAG: DUF4382 domain-containing protein [Candidatus Methylomirabilales bacterium]
MERTRMGGNPALSRTLVLGASVLLALAACSAQGEQQTGRVAVRVTDHRAGIGDFATLHVQFAEISLHRRGASRWTGWVELLRNSPAVDIVPLKDGRWATVGEARVGTGRYDAVRVRFGDIQGTLRRGKRLNMSPIGSTIAVDLDVQRDSRRTVLIDLYVEDQTEHQPGLYAVKIQEITIGKADE